jgi:kynureninase
VTPGSRNEAAARDTADPLAPLRARFVIDEPELIYLDGNSLGRLTVAGAAVIEHTVTEQWGRSLVRAWHEWIDLSLQIGDALAGIIGARPGEVMLCDQTSVNLYKLAWAALAHSGRPCIVTDDTNFPSDIYILDAVAAAFGGELRIVTSDPIAGPDPSRLAAVVDDGVGLVSLSHVAFKSGALADLAGITDHAHSAGALVLWDLSHSAGAVPVDLDRHGVDLAVGCTYKHLNGGPGAPAFLYVTNRLQEQLRSPLPGWFGHADMFAFDLDYVPAPGIRRFASGTPPVVSLRGAEAGIATTAEVGIEAIRAKSIDLTSLIVDRFDAELAHRGFALGSPRSAAHRGSHVSLRHPEAYRITQALIDRDVVPDFRAPDTIRLGVAPLYTSYCEVWDAVAAIGDIAANETYLHYPSERHGVT